MSTFIWTIDPKGENLKATLKGPKLQKYIRDMDKHGRASSFHRASASNIYRCADGKWFQLHGSLNPDPVLVAIGLPYDAPAANIEQSWIPFKEKVAQIRSAELRHLIADSCGQAGDVCNSVSEYFASEQGKANSHVGLFEIHPVPSETQSPAWWPSTSETSPARPLAGLKVVDLTRIIAGPSITRGLAELGASVIRVASPNIADFSALHVDLHWGKWSSDLDLKSLEGRRTLQELIKEADVVVNGYRPFVLDKYGFSETDVIDLVSDRDRGIISVRENCYGWHGPWSHRPGWQPVSDACVGISHSYGKALGLKDNEPVTPLFPSSDYMTGVAGVVGILCALIQRAEKGGSYKVDLALNYYNQWLARSCGTYPEDVWEDLWSRTGKLQFRAEHAMEHMIPKVIGRMKEESGNVCFRDEFFEERRSGILGVDIRTIKPVIRFPNGEVKLQYNVGTRGSGTDAAKWPADLLTEVVR